MYFQKERGFNTSLDGTSIFSQKVGNPTKVGKMASLGPYKAILKNNSPTRLHFIFNEKLLYFSQFLSDFQTILTHFVRNDLRILSEKKEFPAAQVIL